MQGVLIDSGQGCILDGPTSETQLFSVCGVKRLMLPLELIYVGVRV